MVIESRVLEKAGTEMAPPVGAVESIWAVKLVPVLVRPALFVAVMGPVWVVAALVKV